MKNYPVLLFCSVLLLFGSCSRKSEDSRGLLTKRIQYDVNIKSPDPEYDWWVQNLEGDKRESLVKNIIENAAQGKVKAYDFVSNKLLSVKDIEQILHRTDSISLESPEPPHELIDTVIVRNLDLRSITRIRFLEEWRMDEKTLAFSKKVAGICPIQEVFTEAGELKGYKPLFWVFFDDEYPGKFELNK